MPTLSTRSYGPLSAGSFASSRRDFREPGRPLLRTPKFNYSSAVMVVAPSAVTPSSTAIIPVAPAAAIPVARAAISDPNIGSRNVGICREGNPNRRRYSGYNYRNWYVDADVNSGIGARGVETRRCANQTGEYKSCRVSHDRLRLIPSTT